MDTVDMDEPLSTSGLSLGEETLQALLNDDRITLLGGFDLDEAMEAQNGDNNALELDGDELESLEGREDIVEDGNEVNEEDNEVQEMFEMGDEKLDRLAFSTMEMQMRTEPSAIETRLASGRPFNAASWNSYELRELYDGIRKYGNSESALVRVLNNSEDLKKSRTIEDVYAKLDEIRQLNAEHRVARIQFEQAHLRSLPVKVNEQFSQLRFVWSGKLDKLTASRRFTRRHDFLRTKIVEYLGEWSDETGEPSRIDIAAGEAHPRTINWPRVYQLLKFCISGLGSERNRLPKRLKLNAMESVVLLTCMDELESVAAGSLNDAKRAEYRGLLHNIIRGDLRHFELRTPLNDKSDHVQPFLDPLNLREWREHRQPDEELEDEEKTEHYPTSSFKTTRCPRVKGQRQLKKGFIKQRPLLRNKSKRPDPVEPLPNVEVKAFSVAELMGDEAIGKKPPCKQTPKGKPAASKAKERRSKSLSKTPVPVGGEEEKVEDEDDMPLLKRKIPPRKAKSAAQKKSKSVVTEEISTADSVESQEDEEVEEDGKSQESQELML